MLEEVERDHSVTVINLIRTKRSIVTSEQLVLSDRLNAMHRNGAKLVTLKGGSTALGSNYGGYKFD